jgi:hypothetical protein
MPAPKRCQSIWLSRNTGAGRYSFGGRSSHSVSPPRLIARWAPPRVHGRPVPVLLAGLDHHDVALLERDPLAVSCLDDAHAGEPDQELRPVVTVPVHPGPRIECDPVHAQGETVVPTDERLGGGGSTKVSGSACLAGRLDAGMCFMGGCGSWRLDDRCPYLARGAPPAPWFGSTIGPPGVRRTTTAVSS